MAMSKAFALIFFIFMILVAGNLALTGAASLLSFHTPSYAAGFTANAENGSGGGFVIHADLFAKDGSGTSYVTQNYGRTPYSYLYPNDWHDGIDISAAYGTPVYSPDSGIVVAVGNQDDYCYHRGFGKYVAVRDTANNLILWYAHLGTQSVAPGETVAPGTELGTIGASGLETGTHLHFSIFAAGGFAMLPRDGCGPEPTGKDIDPLNYLGRFYF